MREQYLKDLIQLQSDEIDYLADALEVEQGAVESLQSELDELYAKEPITGYTEGWNDGFDAAQDFAKLQESLKTAS